MARNFLEGLTKDLVAKSADSFGKNQLPQKEPTTKLQIFFRQFRSPLVYILALAALATLLLGDVIESIGIGLVVLINSVLGFVQENQAENTLNELRNQVSSVVTVLRNGQRQDVETSEIVVGDLVIVKFGDKIPADGLVIDADNFTTNEAALTGESTPVTKTIMPTEQQNELATEWSERLAQVDLEEYSDNYKALMGTSVLSGVAKVLIIKVGAKTEFGSIAHSLATEEEQLTPLQRQIKEFGRTLTYFIGVISSFVLIWSVAAHSDVNQIVNAATSGDLSLLGEELLPAVIEGLELAISVAVSAIPEGLVIALTIILTLGMRKILERNALVRKLISAETLGAVDTICIDKTGTLTEGTMKVTEVRFRNAEMGKKAIFFNNNEVNSVENSLKAWMDKRVSAREIDRFNQESVKYQQIFNSKNKYAATVTETATYIVGAPEILLSHSNLSESEASKVSQELNEIAESGIRLVATAHVKDASITEAQLQNSLPNNLVWNGLVLIEDPIREDLLSVFQQANQAGIDIKVITGDIGKTANGVLRKIGVNVTDEQMISGSELKKLSTAELKNKVEHLKLFYRTSPNQKLKIVKALQENDHSVAMMGDGINDTPALKRAEIGIVVNNATSVSKDVADMVLLDSNFKTIIAAIEQGRTIFANMRKVLAYLLSDAFEALGVVLLSFIFNLATPLVPLQILYVNFVTDSLPDLALAFEKSEPEIMQKPPRRKNAPLLDGELKKFILVAGTVITSSTFLVFAALQNFTDLSIEYQRSIIFLLMSINSLIYIFSVRSFRKSLWQYNPFENKILNIGVLIAILGTIMGIYFPPLQSILTTVSVSADAWLIAIVVSIIDVAVIEILKQVISKR